MGAINSTQKLSNLSAQDVGKLVGSLGGKFVEYESSIIANGISGEILESLEKNDLKELLQDIGIVSVAHQTVLISHFDKLKKLNSPPIIVNSDNDTGSVYYKLPPNFQIISKLTRTPRSIMNELFEIQGIALDPTDLDPAINKIANYVGRGFGDGVNTYDCFISYRVAADADLAEKLYLYLKTKGIHTFLDKKCLKNGERWAEGFLSGNL